MAIVLVPSMYLGAQPDGGVGSFIGGHSLITHLGARTTLGDLLPDGGVLLAATDQGDLGNHYARLSHTVPNDIAVMSASCLPTYRVPYCSNPKIDVCPIVGANDGGSRAVVVDGWGRIRWVGRPDDLRQISDAATSILIAKASSPATWHRIRSLFE